MVNIDEVDNHYEAVVYANPSNTKFPSSVAYLETKNKNKTQKATAYVNPVDPRNGFECKWEDIAHLYHPEVLHADKASVSLNLRGGKLHVSTTSTIGVILNSTLSKATDDDKSKVVGREMSWKQFKAHVARISKSKYLFRGQKEPWRLRTLFHRRGRYRISNFIQNDVKLLHQRLSAITSHYFDLNVPEQNGAFYNLLQHHGYPTPLLDWSFSPYVAAFFAFRDLPIKYKGKGRVRIYVFDNDAWQKKYRQIQNINPPYPHLSVMSFIAINNPRLVPQQAVTTVTNIDDIEGYVQELELESKNTYLSAIDIPANEREKAMLDLRFMGITAGSMFPGIDGVCEELRENNFEE